MEHRIERYIRGMTSLLTLLGFFLVATGRFGVEQPVPRPLLGPFASLDAACKAIADPAVHYVGSDPCRAEAFALPPPATSSAILEARGVSSVGGPLHLALRTARGWFIQSANKPEFHMIPKKSERVAGGAAEGELLVLTQEASLSIGQQGACFADDQVLEQHFHVACAVGRSGTPACARLPDHVAVVTDRGRKYMCSARTSASAPPRSKTTVHARRDVRFPGGGVVEMTEPVRRWKLTF
jgi:hypothetical protein